MVCWLRFLQQVMDSLKGLEQNPLRRKRLALDVLKEIEAEEGHDLDRIEKSLGSTKILRIAKRLKKKKILEEERSEEKEVVEVEEARAQQS